MSLVVSLYHKTLWKPQQQDSCYTYTLLSHSSSCHIDEHVLQVSVQNSGSFTYKKMQLYGDMGTYYPATIHVYKLVHEPKAHLSFRFLVQADCH